jgi:hypothetical protein
MSPNDSEEALMRNGLEVAEAFASPAALYRVLALHAALHPLFRSRTGAKEKQRRKAQTAASSANEAASVVKSIAIGLLGGERDERERGKGEEAKRGKETAAEKKNLFSRQKKAMASISHVRVRGLSLRWYARLRLCHVPGVYPETAESARRERRERKREDGMMERVVVLGEVERVALPPLFHLPGALICLELCKRTAETATKGAHGERAATSTSTSGPNERGREEAEHGASSSRPPSCKRAKRKGDGDRGEGEGEGEREEEEERGEDDDHNEEAMNGAATHRSAVVPAAVLAARPGWIRLAVTALCGQHKHKVRERESWGRKRCG